MKLIFERSVEGRGCSLLPECDVPVVMPSMERKSPLRLPQVSENDISRHYTQLANATHGVNDGAYPLGSCTMKYNPKVNDEAASLPGFTRVHPLQRRRRCRDVCMCCMMRRRYSARSREWMP